MITTKLIPPEKIKKMLLVQVAGIGDLTLATPTLRALRNRFSKSHISLLTTPGAAGVIIGSPYIDEIYIFDIHKYLTPWSFLKLGAFRHTLKLIRRLRQKHFGLIVNLYNLNSIRGALRMAFLFYSIGAKYRVGRDTDGKGFFYNLKVPEKSSSSEHEVERNLNVARILGAKVENKDLEVPVFAEDRNYVSKFFSRHQITEKDLVIGINPGGFRPSFRWSTEGFAQVANELSKKYRAKIIITVNKEEIKLANKISNLMDIKPAIAAKTTLKELAALIQRCRLFITNNSGPMHIAVAVKTPLVVLWGPAKLYKFRPYYDKDKYMVVKKDVSCYPCNGFRCRKHTCMKLIKPEEVLRAADIFLERFGNAKS